jgi:2-succinyl-5-enolpyruvyl-6-hydroxy-3-cyclohexene-1-carboxylate synthase
MGGVAREAPGARLGDRATDVSASPAPGSMGGTPATAVRALVEELVRAGVREAVVCPGSRSTPVALALAVEPAIRVLVHIDERAAAYFALGLAKANRRPVAVLATSGTAAVNFAPAVVEAREGRTPLIVLTADRPPELRDRGAPQAIDQERLYGRQVKWYAEIPTPEAGSPSLSLLERHLRGVVRRAVAVAAEAPAGPIQLNLPYREPLVPSGSLLPAGRAPADDGQEARYDGGFVGGERRLTAGDLDHVAERVRGASRGLIVCGPLDRPGFGPAVARLASVTGFPILADGIANVRRGAHDRSHVVGRHDALVRVPAFREARSPDLVIRFGGTPTSKAVMTMLAEDAPAQLVVDDGGWIEPTIRPATIVHAEPVALARALAGRLAASGPPRGATVAWLEAWLAADRAADGAIRDWLAALDEPFEGAPFAEIADELPEDAFLFAGNSMPIRDLDAYLPAGGRPLRCLGNRGANGIDGVVSTSLGVAAAGLGPVVLVVGDLSFLHDLNALVAARLHGLSATVVLVNNDGGGIFSFLPQAETDRPEVGLPEHYEALFGTPHGVDLAPIVAALGGEHVLLGAGRSVEPGAIGAAVAASVSRPGVRVLELRTDRRRNVELHRACMAAVSAAVEASLEATREATPTASRRRRAAVARKAVVR